MSEEKSSRVLTLLGLLGLAALVAVVIAAVGSADSDSGGTTESGMLAYVPEAAEPFVRIAFMFASLLLVIGFLMNIGWIKPIIKPKQRQDPFAPPEEE